jgi:hypothetical protein
MKKNEVILVIGQSRSGTSLISRMISDSLDAHLENEPHILWKNLDSFTVEDVDCIKRKKLIPWVRSKLLEFSNNKILVEKSPPNSLRPELIKEVFPDAKIIYIQREPIACIFSNYIRTKKKHTLGFVTLIKKYIFSNKLAQNVNYSEHIAASGKRKLTEQIHYTNILHFIIYSFKLLYLRYFEFAVPFGPKLHGYDKIQNELDIINYHVGLHKESERLIVKFDNLFDKNILKLNYELFVEGGEALNNLLNFLHLNDQQEAFLRNAHNSIKEYSSSFEMDSEIKKVIESRLRAQE